MACQAMGPVVHGLEREYEDRVGFVYLDVDDPANRPLADRLQATGQPRFYLLDGRGEVVEVWVGPVRGETLRKAFDRVLAAEGG